eukprot:6482529-Amphidinium_carterae.8
MGDDYKSSVEQVLVGQPFAEASVRPDAACIADEGNHRERDDVSELDKLIQKGTWDINFVREVLEVRAGKHGPAAMGEKHSEVEDMSLREYKARIVFQGNNIRMSDNVSASEVFKYVSKTPANMSIARTAIGTGLAVGMSATLCDVSQAYLQSYIFKEGKPGSCLVASSVD